MYTLAVTALLEHLLRPVALVNNVFIQPPFNLIQNKEAQTEAQTSFIHTLLYTVLNTGAGDRILTKDLFHQIHLTVCDICRQYGHVCAIRFQPRCFLTELFTRRKPKMRIRYTTCGTEGPNARIITPFIKNFDIISCICLHIIVNCSTIPTPCMPRLDSCMWQYQC